MVNLTDYPVKAQINAIKANGTIPAMIANGEKWEDIETHLKNSANVSNEVFDYFKKIHKTANK